MFLVIPIQSFSQKVVSFIKVTQLRSSAMTTPVIDAGVIHRTRSGRFSSGWFKGKNVSISSNLIVLRSKESLSQTLCSISCCVAKNGVTVE